MPPRDQSPPVYGRREILKVGMGLALAPLLAGVATDASATEREKTSREGKMKLIGIEEHFTTPELNTVWASAPIADDSLRLNVGVIGERLSDLGKGRLAIMDETGLDVQVLAPAAPGLHNLGAEAVVLARRTNDFVAATVAAHFGRFQGLATLPVSAPKEAVRELERSVQELGLKGAMLYGRVRDRNLDSAEFWPIFEAAASLRIPLFIHPQIPPKPVRDASYAGLGEAVDLALSCYALGWHYEAGLQYVRLVLSGVFDRYPGLQVILGHWGEVVIFYLERMAMLDRVAKLARPFAEYARTNLYLTASGMFSENYLQRAIDIVGVDRILFSTDYPYQYRPGGDARRFLNSLKLLDDDRAKFASGNWERLSAR